MLGIGPGVFVRPFFCAVPQIGLKETPPSLISGRRVKGKKISMRFFDGAYIPSLINYL